MFRGPQFETAATKIFHLVFTHGKLRSRTYVTAVFSMFVFLCENGMSPLSSMVKVHRNALATG